MKQYNDLTQLTTYELLELREEFFLGMRECQKLADDNYRRIMYPKTSIGGMKRALKQMTMWDKQTAWAREAMDRIHGELMGRELTARLEGGAGRANRK